MNNETHLKEHFSWMTEDQWECFEMLCDLFYGAHHIIGKIQPSGERGIIINSTNCRNRFGSYDYDNLTRAVVMAHDRMIRFAIEPSGPNMLRLVLHKRHKRDGDMTEKHPSLEDAVAKIRGAAAKEKGE